MAAGPTISQVFSETYMLFQEVLRDELEKAGLAGRVEPGTGPILFELFREDGRPISAIGDRLGLARSTMTSTVARLVNREFVETRSDPNDGRVKLLYLTPAGRQLRRKLRGVIANMDGTLSGDWSKARTTDAERVLAEMRDRLRSRVSR